MIETDIIYEKDKDKYISVLDKETCCNILYSLCQFFPSLIPRILYT